MMKYPNVVWAIEKKRLAHYELAVQVKIERTRLSRCLHGASEFTPTETARICEALGYSREWLFAEPRPPVISTDAELATTVPAVRDLMWEAKRRRT